MVEAVRILQRLDYSPDVRADVNIMMEDMQPAGSVSIWPTPTQKRALTVGVGLMIFQVSSLIMCLLQLYG